MKHEPHVRAPDAYEEDDLDRLIASLPPAPGIKHVDDDEENTRVEPDIAAGRVYPHALVGEWLKTWGDPGYKPFFEWLESQKS